MKCFKILIKLVVALAFVGVLYYFSRQSAFDSEAISRKCTDLFINAFGHIGLGHQAQRFLFYVDLRKIAHFVLFFIFGITSFLIFNVDNDKLRYAVCFGVSIVLSIADEVHQSFVAGREATAKDVIIDILGAAIGLLFVFIVNKIIVAIKRKKREED